MEITSVNNELVKEIVKLQQRRFRKASGKFLLEGYKAIKEALDFGIKIEHIFTEEDSFDFPKELLIYTNKSVLKKLSTTESAPEVVAVGIQKKYNIELLKNFQKVLLLEDIKDVGNLGTIIRSAVAFCADAIVLYGQSVDIYNPKCVRASVGNLWKIPIFNISEIEELKFYFNDFERIATLPRTNNLLKNFEFKTPSLIMFGSEANGLSNELIDFSTNSVKIEMDNAVESLNLATSVSVVMYELFMTNCK
ncbi:RNA methyltransferase [bacterium]|nr:RNA methyltransferase [bacterium]